MNMQNQEQDQYDKEFYLLLLGIFKRYKKNNKK